MPNLVETMWEKITARVEDTRDLDGIPLIDTLSWLGAFEGPEEKTDQWWDKAVQELLNEERRTGWYQDFGFLTLHKNGYIVIIDNRMDVSWKHEMLDINWRNLTTEGLQDYAEAVGEENIPPHLSGKPVTEEWKKLVVDAFIQHLISPTLLQYL